MPSSIEPRLKHRKLDAQREIGDSALLAPERPRWYRRQYDRASGAIR